MESEKKFYSKAYMVFCWLIAAAGGLLFGYDIGISGGLIAMDDFLLKLFPVVYAKKQHAKDDNYCKFGDQYFQLFISSYYLAATISSFIASIVCSTFGRKAAMFIVSLLYLTGGLLVISPSLAVVILGRILFGCGIGFANEVFPLYLSEIAPTSHRGAVNILFQLFVTIGILCAILINYFASNIHPDGWSLALGLPAVPVLMLSLGYLVITETPASLVECNRLEKGRIVLENIRRREDVDAEFNQLVAARQLAHQVKNPFKKLTKPSSRPPLVVAILLQLFQQFTGINAVMFYAPFLFQTIGFKNNASLLSSVIIGTLNVISTLVSILTVDKLGRRVLLLQACCQMFITQTIIGTIFYVHLKAANLLERGEAIAVVVLVCLYVMSFAWSWGPLGWLIPSEIFPLETRTAGYAVAVSSNMLCTVIIAHALLPMMCHMHAGIFFFFSAWIIIMSLFVVFFLPETKNIPIDEMNERVWKQHWFWKRYMADD